MNPKLQKLYDEIKTLSHSEALKAIGLIFNEQGLRDMLGYYTADAVEATVGDKLSPDDAKLIQRYMADIKLAKKLIAKNKNV